MRHASFFSGVGGLDIGFERAGIKTVSVCEIDPYASSVLAERFPSAPNLGSITEVNAHDIPNADIWSGGFPCQDLSVAGKRAGFAGKRSSLAFTFLDLVEQRRPRWIVLENVLGLLSSNQGRDFARLLGEMDGLGYGVAWRTLDARYFGVAQRRRRVFIVGSLGTDRAAEVLFECEGCDRHPAPRWTQRQGVASGTPDGSGIAGTITRRFSKGVNSTIDEPLIVSGQAAHTDRVRAANGVAGRVDDQPGVDTFGAETHRALQARDWKAGVSNQDIGEDGYLVGYQTRADVAEAAHRSLTGGGSDSPQSERIWSEIGTAPTLDTGRAVPQVFRKSARAQTSTDSETWVEGEVANTLNSFDVGDVRTTHAVVGGGTTDDPTLPAGLDSHRYRCCGNGVVAPVAEWIGRRIIAEEGRL
jgi:site-specific DNA-cytosine methylase